MEIRTKNLKYQVDERGYIVTVKPTALTAIKRFLGLITKEELRELPKKELKQMKLIFS